MSEAERFFVRGSKQAALGRHAEAVGSYSASLAIAADSYTASENLGISLSALSRKHEAASAFERAVKIAPSRSESYSLLARALFESGKRREAKQNFIAALALAPSSAALHYEYARSDQLFGPGSASARYFASAQRLALSDWRDSMGCGSTGRSHDASSSGGGPTNWTNAGAAVQRVRLLSSSNPDNLVNPYYGRRAPLPFDERAWPRNAGLRWPSLRFADRPIAISALHDVWISGNDGVVTDDQCNVYLPSHGFQIPLHLNLPHERLAERSAGA